MELRLLGQAIGEAGFEALSLDNMVLAAKACCPVDTGTLMSSVRAKRRGVLETALVTGGVQYTSPKLELVVEKGYLPNCAFNFGEAETNITIYEDERFIVMSPDHPLNCREDGGHLIMVKKEKVTDRSDMTAEEAIDFMRISMMVGKAMYQILGVERVNYEDLANWGLDDPGGPKMHLHFFGRARRQIHQVRGQHIALFPKGHPIYNDHLKPFTVEEAQMIREKIEEISHEEKYVKMVELAGIN